MTDTSSASSDLWVVVIGRNEGERLVRCLDSIVSTAATVVYVDSASTDGSVAMARGKGVEVVELDMSIPFTAARARNAGVKRLRQVAAPARFIQFIDGDCEIIPGWFEAAREFVAQRADVAIVCGGVRERFPERSVYNRIQDQSAMLPPGETEACGGIFLIRAETFDQVDGFRDEIFAGEEPELCLRIRNAGHKVWRLALPMAWHDSAMLRFNQWWRRTRRVGYTFAQAASLYGAKDPSMRTQARSAWIWAALIPIVTLAGLLLVGPLALLLLLVYPLQVVRQARRMKGAASHRFYSAGFMVLGKFPELVGQCQYWLNRNDSAVFRSFQKS
jgi:GT2 family glycosyltransferase